MSVSSLLHSSSVTLTVPPDRRNQSEEYSKTPASVIELSSSKPCAMRQRCVLGVLYLLQIAVLTGVVATYILNNNSGHKPHEAPSLPPKPQTSPRGRDENVKHVTKMKQLSLAQVLENIRHVRNITEFYRMFAANNPSDEDIENLLNFRPADNNTAWPKKRRRKKDGKPSSPYKDGGSGSDYKKRRYAKLRARDADSGVSVDEGNGMEYQNDAPSSSWSETTEVLQAAIDHVHRQESDSAGFECQAPTPFFHRPQQPWTIFMPDCIKLYRCMNFTGCCKPPKICSPKNVQLVRMAFLVVHIGPMHSPLDAYMSYDNFVGVTLTFENHTECACAVPKKEKRCDRVCPTPFIVNPERTMCTCICPQTSAELLQECNFIQQGLKPLNEKDLECIKSTKCYPPPCERGVFDVPTGLCPLSTTYALPSHQFLNPLNYSDYRSHIPGFGKNETRGDIDLPFKVLSTTKSPEKIKNEQAVASVLARQNPHISSAYHEHQQHRLPTKPKPHVKVNENGTIEGAKIIAKMPNPGMSGSYHENYRPFRPLPKKVNINESLSSNSSLNNMTRTTNDSLETVRDISSNHLNKSREGIPNDIFPVSNLSKEVNNGTGNTSITPTPVFPSRDKSTVVSKVFVTATQAHVTTSKLEEHRNNNARSLPSSEDGDQIPGASKHVQGPPVPTAADRWSTRDMPPDQEDGSTDLVQQEGSSHGSGRGAPVDQVEDDARVYDKGSEGSGQD